MDWPYPLILVASVIGFFFLGLALFDPNVVKEWFSKHRR